MRLHVPPGPPPSWPGRFRWRRWGAIAALVAGGAVLFLWNPAETRFFPPCLFRLATGLSCPGCGAQRALHQLLHGNVTAAWRLHPILVLALPAGLAWLAWRAAARRRGRPQPGSPFPRSDAWRWAVLAAILLFTALRNVPYDPFTLFAAP